MISKDDDLFGRIRDHLNPHKTEAEITRDQYRNIARKILISLGHEGAIDRVDHAIQESNLGFKKLLEEMGRSPDDFAQMAIESTATVLVDHIPDLRASMQLLRTAVSGIPQKPGDKDDIVIEFPLAAPSDTSITTDINPHGQSKSTPVANIEGTEKLLKALLKETGFVTEEKFNFAKSALTRSNHFDWTHPDNNGLKISIEKPQTKKPQTPLDWAYRIKITNTKA